ncbi:MAG TPA: class I SAM-dependent methyltransferase [Pyrinomonadaceae bacterium]|jgi:SAM-dependent methyltransferase
MSKEDTDEAYDGFARVYNRHWAEEVPAQILTVIDRLLVPSLPAGARVLDLCCGTGYTLSQLTLRGFEVTGLDVSKEMLRHARRNAPAASLILADARSFTLPPVYMAVVSTFDSLNHLMTIEELTRVFRNVRQALARGGLFLFDMNMEEGFIENWADYYAIVEEKDVCILRGVYDREQKIGRYDITVFHLRGQTWQRADTLISEKCYTAKEIRRALRAAGFKEVSIYDAETDMELTEHVGRKFFLTHA